MVFILISGATYGRVFQLFGLLGMQIASESFFSQTVVPKVDKATQQLLDEFIQQCQMLTPDPNNVHFVIDAGWSHPGWWARECTVIAIDGRTGLPLVVKHVEKGKNGYNRSSKSKNIMKLNE